MRNLRPLLVVPILLLTSGLAFAQQPRKIIINQDCSGPGGSTKSVLQAPWKKIVCTPVDISIKTRITDEMIADIKKSNSAAAQYVAKFFMADKGGSYMWDELAAAA